MEAVKCLKVKKNFTIFVQKSITAISFTNYEFLQPQFAFMTIETFSIGEQKCSAPMEVVKKLLQNPIILSNKNTSKMRYFNQPSAINGTRYEV